MVTERESGYGDKMFTEESGCGERERECVVTEREWSRRETEWLRRESGYGEINGYREIMVTE